MVSLGLARTLMAQDKTFWLSSRSNEIATSILLLPSSEEDNICIGPFYPLPHSNQGRKFREHNDSIHLKKKVSVLVLFS